MKKNRNWKRLIVGLLCFVLFFTNSMSIGSVVKAAEMENEQAPTDEDKEQVKEENENAGEMDSSENNVDHESSQDENAGIEDNAGNPENDAKMMRKQKQGMM